MANAIPLGPEPHMHPPTLAEKEALTSLLAQARAIVRTPVPVSYVLPNPMSDILQHTMDRLIICEMSMYPSRHMYMRTITSGPYSFEDLDNYHSIQRRACDSAKELINNADDAINLQAQEVAQLPLRDRCDKTSLWFTDPARFIFVKDQLTAEIRQDNMTMPQDHVDFMGVELAKYYNTVARCVVAQAAGRKALVDFLRTEGYWSHAAYFKAMRAWDSDLNEHYKFYKRIRNGVEQRKAILKANQARADARNKRIRKLRKDRKAAPQRIDREPVMTHKGKSLLRDAVDNDDEFVLAYIKLTPADFTSESDANKAKRMGKLARLIHQYRVDHPEVVAREPRLASCLRTIQDDDDIFRDAEDAEDAEDDEDGDVDDAKDNMDVDVDDTKENEGGDVDDLKDDMDVDVDVDDAKENEDINAANAEDNVNVKVKVEDAKDNEGAK